jgi:hypothetical protein
MPNDDAIDLFVKVDFWELYRANLEFAVRQARFFLIGAAFLALATGSVLVHANSPDLQDDRWITFAQNVKPLFTLSFIFLFIFPVTSLINTRKAFRDPRAANGFKYRVSPETIRVEGSSGVSDLNWTAFLRARETSPAFWLFVTPTIFHLIPKRCFATNDDIVRFREIIRVNIPKAKLQ